MWLKMAVKRLSPLDTLYAVKAQDAFNGTKCKGKFSADKPSCEVAQVIEQEWEQINGSEVLNVWQKRTLRLLVIPDFRHRRARWIVVPIVRIRASVITAVVTVIVPNVR